MSAFTNRPHTALLVIDVQNGVVADCVRRDATIATIANLVDRARGEDVPVVWIQHSDDENMPEGSEKWDLVPELHVRDGEALVSKRFGDSFEDTKLESVLTAARTGRRTARNRGSSWTGRSAARSAAAVGATPGPPGCGPQRVPLR